MTVYRDTAADDYPEPPPVPTDEPMGLLPWVIYGFTWLIGAAFVAAIVYRAVEPWWPFRGAFR